MSIEAIAELFMQHIWSKKSLSVSMTLDRGPQFVVKMWDSLCKLLNIKAKLSTLTVDKKINSPAATSRTIKLDDYLQNIYHKLN